jgi:hypothetical protein
MKIILFSVFLVSAISFNVFAQSNVTDREFQRFKGKVKSVRTDTMTTEDSNKKVKNPKRTNESEYTFSANGSLLQIVYPYFNLGSKTEHKDKLIFYIVDGFKTFKRVSDEKSAQSENVFKIAPVENPIAVEDGEKIVAPDGRFDQKYTYEYDSQGRVKIERQFENNGRLFKKREFVYNEKGQIIEEVVKDSIAITKLTYEYDVKGNLIVESENRDIIGEGMDSTSKTKYSDYKMDSQGNWIERRSSYFYEGTEMKFKTKKIEHRTISYY